jgi:hypothetical protein
MLRKNGGAKLGNKADAGASGEPAHAPNPRRVAAGQRNRARRKGLTPAGRERLRQAALKHRPWRFSTGPRTAAGKANVAASCKARQKGPRSVRELRRDLAELRALMAEMRACRQAAAGATPACP